MMSLRLLESGLLLGLYVLLAGSYGLAYTLSRLRASRTLRVAAGALYGLHVLVAITIVYWAPLGLGWKALLIVSSLAMLAIPPFTWRYLEHTHHTGSASV